ncbi:hypothetical protein TTHERM_00929490 (macronuclear) [Tetrahymena thermophila SB210]|uniref:Uncharacterized protein n=1 Tax=Tetrahymena thermophila (strain SB210) TaxID=312017 RepID=Q24CJ3_TETTS|nr:hypothetical protein TTHERM_00929490 [Tetrahymena thermophila SB210]EAS05467.1 hypothetical protein TTHERM_00929490 [Tetrahymena thermophila SB210]|eukprot:XP_001025712.1 hypothetical protein TTHERM_00929490 [Tetrahymena thermophila SB210]
MSEQNYIDIKNPQSINGQDQFDITSPPKTDLLKDQLIIPTKSCRQQKLDSKKEEVEEENKSSFINEETYKQSFEDNTNEEIELLELKSENENEKLLFMQRQKTQSSGDDFPFANDSFSKDKTFFDRNTQCVGQFSNTQDFQQNDIDYQSQYPIQHDLIQYDQNYENQNEYENIKPQTEAPQSLEYQSEGTDLYYDNNIHQKIYQIRINIKNYKTQIEKPNNKFIQEKKFKSF